MSRTAVSLALTLALAFTASAAEPRVINLWPGKAPGETKDIGPEKYLEQKSHNDVKRLTNVSDNSAAITATYEMPSIRKQYPSPTAAMMTPPSDGPISRPALIMELFSAIALDKSSRRSTSFTTNDCRVGTSNALISP